MKFLVLALFILTPVYSLSASECLNEVDLLIKKYELNPDKAELALLKKDGKKLLDQLFAERLKWHQKLPELSSECRVKLKDLFLKMREREDYIGAHFYPAPQISAESIDYKKVPVPIYSAESYAPFHLSDTKNKFAFKSGDILITKGVSFTSSTISEVVAKRGLFSHMVFVYVDEVTQKVFTMESYIGYGVKIFPIEEALKNENARILVLRAKDQVLAKTAASYMFDRIKKSEAKGERIPYDYALDFSDNKKLSCEEIAYDAFKIASLGKMIIPENLSRVDLRDKKFLKSIGVKEGALMMPVDLEIDSRFEMILDWTDYRIIRDSIRKDAVMGEIFHWMNEYEYRFHWTFRSIAARIVWFTRPIPGLWDMLAGLSGIPIDFQNDVPGVAISTLEKIKGVASVMLNFIASADEEFQRLNNRWMTPVELRDTVDMYIKTNPLDIIDNFHK